MAAAHADEVHDPLEAAIEALWSASLADAVTLIRRGQPGKARYVLARAGLTIQNALDRAGVA